MFAAQIVRILADTDVRWVTVDTDEGPVDVCPLCSHAVELKVAEEHDSRCALRLALDYTVVERAFGLSP